MTPPKRRLRPRPRGALRLRFAVRAARHRSFNGLDSGLGISFTGAMRASRGSDVQPAGMGGLVFRADNVTIGDDYSLH